MSHPGALGEEEGTGEGRGAEEENQGSGSRWCRTPPLASSPSPCAGRWLSLCRLRGLPYTPKVTFKEVAGQGRDSGLSRPVSPLPQRRLYRNGVKEEKKGFSVGRGVQAMGS